MGLEVVLLVVFMLLLVTHPQPPLLVREGASRSEGGELTCLGTTKMVVLLFHSSNLFDLIQVPLIVAIGSAKPGIEDFFQEGFGCGSQAQG